MVCPKMGLLATLQGCYLSCNAAGWRGDGAGGPEPTPSAQQCPFLVTGKAPKAHEVLEVIC